jgi:predicted HTH domain antitoxin
MTNGRRHLVATQELTIRYPEGLEQVVHLTKAEMERHIRLMAALKMFELGKLSSGKAAELAGMSRIEFIEACGLYRVSIFNYSDDEIEAELASDLGTIDKVGNQDQH